MTLCINLVIRFFSWFTLSLLTNRMSTLSTGPLLIKRTPPQFPLKLDKNDDSFYYLAKPVLICGKRYAAQRWRMRTRAWPTGGAAARETGHHYQPRPHWAPPAPQENIQGFIHKHTHNSQFSGAGSSLHRREHTAHDVSMQSFNTAAARRSQHHHCCSFSLHTAKLLKSSLVFFTQQNVDARERKEIARKFNKCLIYFLQDMKKKLNIDRDKDNRSITVATAQ